MKKFILVIFFLILVLVPALVYAQMFSVPNPLPQYSSIQAVIKVILDVAFSAAGLVAVAFLITGGYRYITSQGNPEAVEAAKATITNSIIGLIVIFVAVLLVNYLLVALNVGPLYRLGTTSSSVSPSASVSSETGLPSASEATKTPPENKTVSPPANKTPTPTPTSSLPTGT